MAVKIEPQRILTNFLRANLTDINSSRSGNWIFPDFPRISDLGNTSYPRIGITKITDSAESMGIFDDNQYHTVTLQLDIVTKKDVTFTVTSTDDSLGTIANSPRLTYDYPPKSVTNIKHTGSAFATVTAKNTDADFTSPAVLAAGTVEWSKSTGNLNFSSADLTSYSGETITSTWVNVLEGEEAVQYLGRQVLIAIRGNWRTAATMQGLFYPKFISNSTIPYEENLGIFRQVLEIQFNIFNIGEGL